MRDLYNEQLEQLDQKLVQMGTMCQESISLAFQCMTDENGVPEDRVATMDDGIDRIEGDTLHIIDNGSDFTSAPLLQNGALTLLSNRSTVYRYTVDDTPI